MKATYLIVLIFIIACFVNAMPGEGVHDYLPSLSREELELWALAAEKHHNLQSGSEITLGGLHDYIKALSNKELIAYITKEVTEHPEINSAEALKKIIEKQRILPVLPLIGKDGGLGSMLWRTDRDTLIKWALAAEKYHNNGQVVIGGLHDQLVNMDRKAVMKYILKETKEHPEIRHVDRLNELAGIKKPEEGGVISSITSYIKELFETKHPRGGLHDYIFRLPREKLVSWALACESYVREVKQELILGGIHDYVDTATNEQLSEYILEQAEKYPELNSSDKLNSLSDVRESKPKMGGLHDYIWRLPREQLVRWALGVESYVKEVKGEQGMRGGFHDYVASATNEEIAQYILDNTKKYPELNNSEKLNSISQKAITVKFGGLHDYIKTVSKERLATWAINIENFIRQKTGEERMGGIHDYVESLSADELRKYILENAAKYEELNSSEKLNKLSNDHVSITLGGLHDYLVAASREQLVEWALASEKYVRTYKTNYFGGIHDYIETATRNQIIKYILDLSNKYDELNSVDKLTALAKDNKVEKLGGIHDWINTVPKEKLMEWALAVENYHREKTGETKLGGGIHDFINTASYNEIADYIIEMANKYDELNDMEKLNEISSTLNDKQFGGLHDYIRLESRSNLVKWALACEDFARKVKGELVLGGIHDYITTATNEELSSYILMKADVYEELNSIDKLNKVSEQMKKNLRN